MLLLNQSPTLNHVVSSLFPIYFIPPACRVHMPLIVAQEATCSFVHALGYVCLNLLWVVARELCKHALQFKLDRVAKAYARGSWQKLNTAAVFIWSDGEVSKTMRSFQDEQIRRREEGAGWSRLKNMHAQLGPTHTPERTCLPCSKFKKGNSDQNSVVDDNTYARFSLLWKFIFRPDNCSNMCKSNFFIFCLFNIMIHKNHNIVHIPQNGEFIVY